MIVEHQSRTFNRTGRQKILQEHITVTLDQEHHRLEITKLDGATWFGNIDDADVERAAVHFDVSSRLINHRESVSSLTEVVASDWPGLVVPLPEDFRHGEYGVGLNVVASISRGERSGLIVARSSRMSVAPGQGSAASAGGSLLRCVPHDNVASEMWILCLDDPDGPIIQLNIAFQTEDWRDFVGQPQFKYGILPGVLRDIFFDIVMNQTSPRRWADTWMKLPGAASKKEDMPTLDDGDSVQDIVTEALKWAEETAHAFSARNHVFRRFEHARRDDVGQE